MSNKSKILPGNSDQGMYSALNKEPEPNSNETKTVTSIRLSFSKFRKVDEIADSHGMDRSKVFRKLIEIGLREIKEGDD